MHKLRINVALLIGDEVLFGWEFDPSFPQINSTPTNTENKLGYRTHLASTKKLDPQMPQKFALVINLVPKKL